MFPFWSDEFDGKELDASKWNFRLHFWGKRQAAFTERAVELDGQGHLRIHLLKRADGSLCSSQLQTGGIVYDIPPEKRGAMWPFGKRLPAKFLHGFGYYEIRCRMNKNPDWWVAFWLQSPSLGPKTLFYPIMKNILLTLSLALTTSLLVPAASNVRAAEPAPLKFTVKLETVMKHDDDKFHWFHPRAAAIPVTGQAQPAIVMTIQKHLIISDYYSGLHVMMRPSPSAPWKGPALPPELDWRPQPDGVTISVADVTPGWHAPTGKVIAIGCQVRYSPKGEQLEDVKRANQTVYAVFDPKTERWTRWQVLELPPEDQFDFARNACAQWLVQPDGTLLVPLYIGRNAKEPCSTTVAECRFDGAKLSYVRHGTVLRLNVVRGLCEPSLIAFHGRYFLTLRNDIKGYVSVSDDGLQFAEQKPWLFDDGAELGSYNTQQHWLAHSDGLFLVYTRRGANNDHIVRHRAPLFMAQVNPETLQVMRSTEKIVVPERGAEMGNFGACAVSETESWVTVSEGMFMKDSRQRGAEGATFVARILWATPNKLSAGGNASPVHAK